MLLIENPSTDPSYNHALEEYLLKNVREDVFMVWQNVPTILIGRNQDARCEYDADYAEEKGIRVVRRLSGGGTIYCDLKNLQYTLIAPFRDERSGIRAAILRDKGTNGEREMAYALHLAGFDVKDVHLTDLASGRETLDDIHFAVFCGGFSNSDVLGSAKGWAAGIFYNPRARAAIDRFYARPDTLSLGICNGCQLMAHLGLLYPNHAVHHALLHNHSHKFESGFVTLDIPQNDSVMLGSLSGARLGVWVAHGEGRFAFPYPESRYRIAARYSYGAYPANPNGSQWSVAGLCSADGRHLAMMPHPQRAIFPWQCAYYPADRRGDEVTPWMEAFVNARRWIERSEKR